MVNQSVLQYTRKKLCDESVIPHQFFFQPVRYSTVSKIHSNSMELGAGPHEAFFLKRCCLEELDAAKHNSTATFRKIVELSSLPCMLETISLRVALWKGFVHSMSDAQ